MINENTSPSSTPLTLANSEGNNITNDTIGFCSKEIDDSEETKRESLSN